ncbi:hypothetical protein H4W79_003290 [Nocardiopsis terrae]|uniref:Uncharacterized protein n=1 Tax=Nocardiopsis terrae TaxID=372655 RepID=A0ABR9HJ80_9ACTN|nr:hypothetical protein [Nocardiopsis terrae]
MASKRRRFADRLGLVLRRSGGGGSIASANTRARRSRASTRLRTWERCVCTDTVNTPPTRRPARRSRARARRVAPKALQEATSNDSDTRVSEVLTCCPPGPEDRENRHVNASAGTVTGPTAKPPAVSSCPVTVPTSVFVAVA